VNNPDFHWSLLVYETKTKKFYHFDTLRGANDSYVQPLTKELLKFLLEIWQDPIHHWETRYHLKQGNSWDCGIAVIEIAKQIMRDYPTYQRILMYTKLDFNFPQARINWRNKLNHA
jgi:Ulp1 family protease